MNVQNFNCWTQDVSYFTVDRSPCQVCTSHLCTPNIKPGLASKLFVMSQNRLIGPLLSKKGVQSTQRRFTLSVDLHENSLLVSNSVHASFSTVKLKHLACGRRHIYLFLLRMRFAALLWSMERPHSLIRLPPLCRWPPLFSQIKNTTQFYRWTCSSINMNMGSSCCCKNSLVHQVCIHPPLKIVPEQTYCLLLCWKHWLIAAEPSTVFCPFCIKTIAFRAEWKKANQTLLVLGFSRVLLTLRIMAAIPCNKLKSAIDPSTGNLFLLCYLP